MGRRRTRTCRGDGAAIRKLEAGERLRGVGWLDGRDAVLAAALHELAQQGLHRAACHQHAELRLEQARPRCPSTGPAESAARAPRGPVPRWAASAAGEPRSTGRRRARASGRRTTRRSGERSADPTAPRATSTRQRVEGHARVDLVLAIRAAREPRLAARRRSRVRGAEGVEQQHALTRLAQVPGGPGAEHARAHHDRVPAGLVHLWILRPAMRVPASPAAKVVPMAARRVMRCLMAICGQPSLASKRGVSPFTGDLRRGLPAERTAWRDWWRQNSVPRCPRRASHPCGAGTRPRHATGWA